MSEPTPERQAIEKFLSLIDKGEVTIFSKEEAAVLQRFARTLLGFEAVGRTADVFKKVLQWIGWAIALWLAVRAGAVEWIKGAVR
ncbi:MAG: hypothetical protein LCH61_16840 [Proteobacteria bacterium]|nr:hypothetical protein [Pseudomonadota bacterium]